MQATATPEFRFFHYHAAYASYPPAPHLSIQDIKMNWQMLEDQGARKSGSIEPNRCVEHVMEALELAQAMKYHLQCLDKLNFSLKQGISMRGMLHFERSLTGIPDGDLLQR